jgi:hypothetical protein
MVHHLYGLQHRCGLGHALAMALEGAIACGFLLFSDILVVQ